MDVLRAKGIISSSRFGIVTTENLLVYSFKRQNPRRVSYDRKNVAIPKDREGNILHGYPEIDFDFLRARH